MGHRDSQLRMTYDSALCTTSWAIPSHAETRESGAAAQEPPRLRFCLIGSVFPPSPSPPGPRAAVPPLRAGTLQGFPGTRVQRPLYAIASPVPPRSAICPINPPGNPSPGGGMNIEPDPADELVSMFSQITTTDHDALCLQFSRILNVDLGVSRFFLEASQWSAERAVHAYLASVDTRGGEVHRPSVPPSAVFVGDLSPLERTLQPGEVVDMQWTFRNEGVEPWPAGTKISFVDGNNMGGIGHQNLQADPGQQVTFVQLLRAPNSPGVYTSTWRMVCPAGYFGDPLWVFMTVGEPSQDVDLTRRDVSLESTGDMRFQEWHQFTQGGDPWQQQQHPGGDSGGRGPRDDEDFMDL